MAMTAGEVMFVDTNVLLAVTDKSRRGIGTHTPWWAFADGCRLARPLAGFAFLALVAGLWQLGVRHYYTSARDTLRRQSCGPPAASA